MSVNQINGNEIRRIVDRLRERGRDIEQAAKRGLREGVEEIVQTAKLNCPVKTGKLQESIHEIEENDGASYKIVADAVNEKGVQYGKIVEYSPEIAHPFLYPAIEQHKDHINDRIKSAVRQEI